MEKRSRNENEKEILDAEITFYPIATTRIYASPEKNLLVPSSLFRRYKGLFLKKFTDQDRAVFFLLF